MSVFDMFSRSSAPQQAAPQQPQAPQGPTTQQSNDGNPNNPGAFQQSNTANPNTAPQQNQSPLDEFAGLFDNTPDENNPLSLDDPYVQIEQAKLMEIAKNQNFVDSPEMMGYATEIVGEANAPKLLQMINALGQQVYGKSAQLTGAFSNEATKYGVQRLHGMIPNMLKDNQSNRELTQLNPNYANPAIAPLVQQAKAAYLKKNPNASESDIAQGIHKYMQMIASINAPAAPQGSQQAQNPGTDFQGFF